MDYEKAFKEAYERASLRFGENVANDIFLEYKESKDERTRRKLVDFFCDWGKTKSHCWGIPVKDIIDWLEKQKCTQKDVDDAWLKGMCDAKDELEKQKPAWSEEDDSMFQSCIGAVATNDYYKGEEKEQIYDWLKSLKQRIGGSYDR